MPNVMVLVRGMGVTFGLCADIERIDPQTSFMYVLCTFVVSRKIFFVLENALSLPC